MMKVTERRHREGNATERRLTAYIFQEKGTSQATRQHGEEPVLDRKEKQDSGEGIRLSLSKEAFFGIALLWD